MNVAGENEVAVTRRPLVRQKGNFEHDPFRIILPNSARRHVENYIYIVAMKKMKF
jgi:hypothetical protein